MNKQKKIYNLNISRLVLLLLPVQLRKPVMLSFLSVLSQPFENLYRRFIQYKNGIDTSVNTQVVYMQKMLNDRYDYYQRRIFIRDTPVNENEYFLFSEATQKAQYLNDESPVMWTDNGKSGTTTPDFDVVFPAGYALNPNEEKQLKQLINNHKIASKKYNLCYE